jgi:hypothetical protein
MKIKPLPAVPCGDTERGLQPEEYSAEAKAQASFAAFSARLKSCPVSKRQRVDLVSKLPDQDQYSSTHIYLSRRTLAALPKLSSKVNVSVAPLAIPTCAIR